MYFGHVSPLPIPLSFYLPPYAPKFMLFMPSLPHLSYTYTHTQTQE